MFFKNIIAEIDSMMARDPAARSRWDVLFSYPSFHAVMIYRLAHWFWMRKWYGLGRWLSHLGRFLSGIEIHPGAKIGNRLFVDHGMGTVIGEMSVIGDDVTLYHGVTLGGVAPSVDSDEQRGQKRHPTLHHKVIVGSGAQILGPVVIGENARVGANAVVVGDVPARTTVIGIPAKVVGGGDKGDVESFRAYGMPAGGMSDPVIREFDTLRAQIEALKEEIADLKAERDGAPADTDAAPRKEASGS